MTEGNRARRNTFCQSIPVCFPLPLFLCLCYLSLFGSCAGLWLLLLFLGGQAHLFSFTSSLLQYLLLGLPPHLCQIVCGEHSLRLLLLKNFFQLCQPAYIHCLLRPIGSILRLHTCFQDSACSWEPELFILAMTGLYLNKPLFLEH